MVKRIIAYTLMGIGILDVLFFCRYSGQVIPYPFLFLLLGIGVILAGVGILRMSTNKAKAKGENVLKGIVDELKATGERITVNFSDCEIKSNNYSEEKEVYEGLPQSYKNRIEGLNALVDETQNTRVVEVYQNVLVFKHNHNGQVETFRSQVISMETTTLRFKLSMQKQTTLYLNRAKKQYYFDLEFLES